MQLGKRSSGWAKVASAAALALGVIAAAHDVSAQQLTERRPFVWGVGPGAGRGALSLGGRLYLPTGLDTIIPIPTFDLNYVRGISDSADFEFRLSSVGIISVLEGGVRLRLAGDERFGLNVKGDVIGAVVIAGGFAGVFGVSPGVGINLGDNRTQLTLIVDVPIALVGALVTSSETAAGGGGGYFGLIRPSITYEFPVGQHTNMFIQAQAYVGFFSSGSSGGVGGFVPNIALGAVF